MLSEDALPEPRIVGITWIVLSALGCLCLGMLPWNPIGGLLQGLLLLAAAYGIWRRRAWSAYGLGLLLITSNLAPYSAYARLFETSSEKNGLAILLISIALSVGLLWLLFATGKALSDRYGARGLVWPWVLGSAALMLFFVLFDVFVQSTGSMENTILIGDRLVVRKHANTIPERGSLVVFHPPQARKNVFIKRVVAIPGDRVKLRNKQLFINGAAAVEPYAVHATTYTDSYRDNFPNGDSPVIYPTARQMLAKNLSADEILVPPGKYFVLGDNRDESLDSRYWGLVDQADTVGIPVMIYYSIPRTEPGAKAPLPITQVRWNRLFHLAM